jgi:hypothetical protein
MMGVTPLVRSGFSCHYSISDDFQELSSPQAVCLGFFMSMLYGVANYTRKKAAGIDPRRLQSIRLVDLPTELTT